MPAGHIDRWLTGDRILHLEAGTAIGAGAGAGGATTGGAGIATGAAGA